MSRAWAILTLTLAILITILGQLPESAASILQNATPEEVRIDTAVSLLLRSQSGRALISKAVKTWKLRGPEELLRVLRPGETSRTDAILTRHYNPATGRETREREVTVYVKTDQSYENMVLDIAHEMVHATSRPAWDPYDPNLTAGRYIWGAIEGEGGEVAAVTTECQVAVELSHQIKINTRRCSGYITGDSSEIDPARIKQDFYRVGKWSSPLSKTLGSEMALFPEMSADSPRLYSSTGNAPYPVALLQEFRALTRIACENSKRRVDSAAGRSIATRSPASEFLERRCQ